MQVVGETSNGFCGDGILDPGEECDDNNNVDGDGCSAICEIEPFCGDGILDPGEECDDNNNVDGDGCSAICEIEPFCGDGNLDPGEQCDDGNNVNGDGCSSVCTSEVPVGEQGCTPGYWKANAVHKKFAGSAWTVENPDDTLAEAGFVPDNGTPSGTTLLNALKFKGGKGEEGMERILLRACIAAKLNAENLNVTYAIETTAEVIAMCNASMDSNDIDTMKTLKDELESFNNAECSINMKGEPKS